LTAVQREWRRSRVLAAATALAVAVVIGAGCSGGSGGLGTSGSSSSTSPARAGSTAGSTPVTDGSTTTQRSSTSTTPVDAGDHGPDYFTSPSKNIGCYLDAAQVRCDVGDKTWTAPPPDTPCPLDYGHGVLMEAGKAPVFSCAGDTTLGGPDVLAYGQTAQRGHLVCASTEGGMTCSDLTSGHSFTVARESYALH
jgi:hypothetical protein